MTSEWCGQRPLFRLRPDLCDSDIARMSRTAELLSLSMLDPRKPLAYEKRHERNRRNRPTVSSIRGHLDAPAYENLWSPNAVDRATLRDSMKNLALNKPARQSSTSTWSRDRDVSQDARGANNGALNEFGFHTEQEREPWWQVDFGDAYAITRVALYNR